MVRSIRHPCRHPSRRPSPPAAAGAGAIFAVAQAPAVDLWLHLPGVQQDSYPTGLRSCLFAILPIKWGMAVDS